MRFDIDAYQAHSGRVTWDDLDLSVFRDRPVSESGLRCLQYMHDIEFHTVCYLRDLLADRIDRRIQRLPGVEIVSRARAAHLRTPVAA